MVLFTWCLWINVSAFVSFAFASVSFLTETLGCWYAAYKPSEEAIQQKIFVTACNSASLKSYFGFYGTATGTVCNCSSLQTSRHRTVNGDMIPSYLGPGKISSRIGVCRGVARKAKYFWGRTMRTPSQSCKVVQNQAPRCASDTGVASGGSRWSRLLPFLKLCSRYQNRWENAWLGWSVLVSVVPRLHMLRHNGVSR